MKAEYGDITRTGPDAFRVKTSGLAEVTDAVIAFSFMIYTKRLILSMCQRNVVHLYLAPSFLDPASFHANKTRNNRLRCPARLRRVVSQLPANLGTVQSPV